MKIFFPHGVFFLIFIEIFLNLPAQKKADKFYLLDTAGFSTLTKRERLLTDSCLRIYHSSVHDTLRLRALFFLKNSMENPIWMKYSEIMGKEAEKMLEKTGLGDIEKKKYYEFLGSSLANRGYYYTQEVRDNEKAMASYNASIEAFEKAGMKLKAALIYMDQATVFINQGKIAEGVKRIHEALKVQEKFGDTAAVALGLENLGQVLSNQNDYVGAMQYLKRSKTMFQTLRRKEHFASVLNLMAIVYRNTQKNDSALDCYSQSMKIYEGLGNEYGIATVLLNQSIIYQEKGELDRALGNYEKSLKLFEKSGDPNAITFALNSIAIVAIKKHDYRKAIEVGKRSLVMAQKIQYPDNIMSAADILKTAYKESGDYKNAMVMGELTMIMRDSILNVRTRRSSIEQGLKYDEEKKLLAMKNEQEKRDTITRKEKEQKNIVILFISISFVLLFIFAGVIFTRFRITRRQKAIIEKQKLEVEAQKHIVEEKNKDITDSINYAKRLQEAILPPLSMIRKYFSESFVFYLPKDIVAGDFYWMQAVDGQVFFAAADCTGHGVPGAMVSVVCANALDRAVKEFGIRTPGEILDKVKTLVAETFEKSESEVQDGMDISLVSFNRSTAEVNWSGANNPLWFVRKGVLNEIKADKQPVGRSTTAKPFTTHRLQTEKDDVFYLFTDGYADQFGGPKGKKFKYKALQELLISTHGLSAEEQKERLHLSFRDWKGNLEQVDDVCIIGIRF